MGISEDIKQEKFKSQFGKAVINILYTNSWINQKNAQVFKSFGLTTPQYNILRILRGQHPKPATVNLLIDRMLDKSSNASRIVDRLEQKGLVKRTQCPNDRRAVDVLISDDGLNILSEMDKVMENWESTHNKLTDEEAETLNYLLDKVRS